MKKKYLIKVKKKDARYVEKLLFNALVDRTSLCSLIKLIELNSDSNHLYFVMGGEQYSCQRVLSICKKAALNRGISFKVLVYDNSMNRKISDLIWIVDSNDAGSTVKKYLNNQTVENIIKGLTTKFVLKHGLLSNHVFCTECDGFADPVELNSLKGHYRCSFCNTDIMVEGPLLTGKKPVNHLSEQEQLYLIGLPAQINNVLIPEELYNGEQIEMGLASVDSIESANVARRRRRRGATYIITDASNYLCDEIEQMMLILG